MKIAVSIIINSTKEKVWNILTDIENLTNTVNAISEIEILLKPETGLIGLKWKETRSFLGKKASEVMWIEEAEANSHLTIEAASHGMEYTTDYSLEDEAGKVRLTLEFGGVPKTKMARFLYITTGFMFRSATKKAFLIDLEDIRKAAET